MWMIRPSRSSSNMESTLKQAVGCRDTCWKVNLCSVLWLVGTFSMGCPCMTMTVILTAAWSIAAAQLPHVLHVQRVSAQRVGPQAHRAAVCKARQRHKAEVRARVAVADGRERRTAQVRRDSGETASSPSSQRAGRLRGDLETNGGIHTGRLYIRLQISSHPWRGRWHSEATGSFVVTPTRGGTRGLEALRLRNDVGSRQNQSRGPLSSDESSDG
jgi:hypothetical protein